MQLYSHIFRGLTCQNNLAHDFEERIPCIFKTKKLQFLKTELQSVDIQPKRQSFQLKIY